MNTLRHSRILLCLLCALGAEQTLGREQHAHSNPIALDGARIELLTGAKGTLDPVEHVFKVSVPRQDLIVTVGGVKLIPAMGLTSWAAFKKTGATSHVMGDMVVRGDQIGSVMDATLLGGLEITALHNHFVGETPQIMFMHIAGHGDEEKLAMAIGSVFSKIKETESHPLSCSDIHSLNTGISAIYWLLNQKPTRVGFSPLTTASPSL